MSDLHGDDIARFKHVIQIAEKWAKLHNFDALQPPILEHAEVFLRSIGEATDVVSKEIYSFADRNEQSLALRPEFTAGVVRALLSNGLHNHALPLKFFSHGPLFRYERPQKGRRRQFHQINYEIFHKRDDNLLLLEILALAQDFLHDLGISDKIKLHLNSLGNAQSRENFVTELKSYLEKYKSELSDESQIRLEKNPVRILDSKSPMDQEIVANGPKLHDFFDEESRKKFENVQQMLKNLQIDFTIDKNLVRGLDYYSDVIFEFITDALGAQNAVLAGGCYNGLVAKMSEGKADLRAVGFAGGIERMIELMISNFEAPQVMKIGLLPIGNDEIYATHAMKLMRTLQKNHFIIEIFSEKNLKKQLQAANKFDMTFAIIFGESELQAQKYMVKNFNDGTQNEVNFGNLVSFLKKIH